MIDELAVTLPERASDTRQRRYPRPPQTSNDSRSRIGHERRPDGAAAIARAYTDAVNRHAYAEAAELLAQDVVLIFPGGRLEGREAWLESRARQQPGELTEEVDGGRVTESDGTGQSSAGRLVQRWAESGEVASEMPVRIAFTVAGGAITRLELIPLAA